MANNKRNKIPYDGSGIEVKHSMCSICSPGFYCGLDCYVKDGELIKVEGWKGHPEGGGTLCTKGLSNREFVYRKDRIMTPLKRVGERGEGKFEPISWDEAYAIVSEKMLEIKEKYGAEKMAFFAGYNKWYRSMLSRFAHSFGSPNYGTEGSVCWTAGNMAWQCITGCSMGMALPTADLLIGWSANGHYSRFRFTMGMKGNKKNRGMKIIIIDPKITPASERLADLYLRPKSGTDGALAHCLANILIQNDWIDKEFIDKHVYGFEDYAAYVSEFTLEKTEAITGVPAADIMKAAEMIHEAKKITSCESASPIVHHTNGMQNYRAIMSIQALKGCIDVPGGQPVAPFTFSERGAGFLSHEYEFMNETFKNDNKYPVVGQDRFPLWYELNHKMQANDLANNILADDEKSMKGLFGMGMNYRMFPDDTTFTEAFKKLDFFVNVDLFLTDTCKWADIVLPACSSLERSEFKTYAGPSLWYTKPVIEPLGESRRDVDIISDLAKTMKLDDELLCSGYEECVKYMFQGLPIDFDKVMASDVPVKLEGMPMVKPGTNLANGWPTPTGKIELKSSLIEAHPEWGLDALPTYKDPVCPDKEQYPFILNTGSRIPNAIHSRLHNSSWTRSLRPDPMAEISMGDAQRLGVEIGDDIVIETIRGDMTFKALPTPTVIDGEVHVYHGYSERDVNELIPFEISDPYSGFPAYKSVYCNVRKGDK